MNYIERNKYLGYIREKRVRLYIEKILKWKVEKTTIALDKYHSIDFVCKNRQGKTILIQVKGTALMKKPFSEKAINYAKNYNADLYYFFVGSKYNSKIYVKKYEENRN